MHFQISDKQKHKISKIEKKGLLVIANEEALRYLMTSMENVRLILVRLKRYHDTAVIGIHRGKATGGHNQYLAQCGALSQQVFFQRNATLGAVALA